MSKKIAKKGPKRRKTRGRALIVVDAKNDVYFVPPGTFTRRITDEVLADEAIKYAKKISVKNKIVSGYFLSAASGRARLNGMDLFFGMDDPTIVRPPKKKK